MTVYLCCVKVCDHRACISSRVKDRRGHCLCWMSKSWTTSCCEDHTYMWTEATSYCCCYKGRTAGTVVRDELLLPARGDGQARERAYLNIHVRLSPCMTIYQRKSLCKYTPSAPVYPCNNNLSGKTETAADCLVYHCCYLSCLPPSVSYLD